jgi:ABC-type multidrug transport system fused ATPase/permease subunit
VRYTAHFALSVYLHASSPDINAVERVVEYLDIPQEPAGVIESSRPPAFWPSSSGAELIQVEDLSIKYAPELEPVINGVSFVLRGGERVGLIGRTGSGKSTLAMAFLRFVEPARGKIIIDGIDITTIGLQDLRSRLVSALILLTINVANL